MGSAGVLTEEDFDPQLNCPWSEPIELRRNGTYGSYIVASRFIAAEEVIVEESPLMLCPCGGQTPQGLVCLTCFKICSGRCSTCNWPVCGKNCERGLNESNLHSDYECKILAKNKVLLQNPKLDYTAIKVLRCLLLCDKDPDKWNCFLQHDAQLDNRWRDLKTKEAREHVVHFIREQCQQTAFDPVTIETVLGICATNEFCLTINDYSRDAFLIFHKISYLTHSCTPNLGSVWKFHPTQESSYKQKYFSVKFFAARDIQPGEILTHSYIPETFSVRKRQAFLAAHYYFYCDCERCRKELFAEISSSEE